MKTVFALLNILLFTGIIIGDLYYLSHGTLQVKASVSALFVLMGLVNLIFAFITCRGQIYGALLCAGLLMAMMGDIRIGDNFILGAGLFALGHILYCLAFFIAVPPRRTDWIPIVILAVFTTLFIKGYPGFVFRAASLEAVCLVYGVIISCMTGKALANAFSNRAFHLMIPAVGSVLFYFSDLMLSLRFFANAPRITDRLCLLTYYPAQALLALSVFLFAAYHRG